jgi:hypothetical protein
MEIWGKPNEKARELSNYLNGIGVEAEIACIKENGVRGERLLGVHIVGMIPENKYKEIASEIDRIAGNFDYKRKEGNLYFEQKLSFPVGCGGDG